MPINNIENSLSLNILNEISDHFTIQKQKKPKSFINHMTDALKNISINQNNTDNKIKNFQLNKTSNNSLNDIMIDLQKSAIALQLIIQIRNKLVSGYQEIMNMQI